MKILLDPQIFNYQKFGGISRYFTELYRYAKLKNVCNIELSLCYSENLHLKNYNYKQSIILNNYSFFGRGFILEIIKKKSYKKSLNILKKNKCDLFIPTYYDTYFLNSIKNTPFVLTVHDMINELFPQYFSDSDQIPKIKKILIEKAAKIITISESTKNDILKFYPQISKSKIEVVYHGYSINKSNYVKNDDKYVLFVGNREGYKNFMWMIQTIKDWLIENNIKCYCVGGGIFTANELMDFENFKINQLLKYFDLEDSLLYSFYKNAIVFIFPSIYEGFGIPILESFASECPIILPNTSCFPEIAGDAGIYYNLNDKESFKFCLNKVLIDNKFRTCQINKGLSRLNNFSWNKTMENTFKIYKDIYNEKL